MESALSLVQLNLISSILTADMLSCNKYSVCPVPLIYFVFFLLVYLLRIVLVEEFADYWSISILLCILNVLSGEGAEG